MGLQTSAFCFVYRSFYGMRIQSSAEEEAAHSGVMHKAA